MWPKMCTVLSKGQNSIILTHFTFWLGFLYFYILQCIPNLFFLLSLRLYFFFPSSPQSITFSVVILFCCIPFLFSFHCSVYYLDCLLTKSTSTFPFDLHQKHSCKTYIKFAVITLVKLFCSLTAWSTTVLDPSVQNNIVKRATGLLIP